MPASSQKLIARAAERVRLWRNTFFPIGEDENTHLKRVPIPTQRLKPESSSRSSGPIEPDRTKPISYRVTLKR